MSSSDHKLAESACYPFNLQGPLCPLLNDKELLAGFYADAGFRQGIKQFCKRTKWAGKPVIGIVVDPEKLKELVASLFNSPEGRERFQANGETDQCPGLHNAIWQWFNTGNLALSQRIAAVCDDVKDRLYVKGEPFKKLLEEVKKENPPAETVKALAYVTLAFAMLQPDDRVQLGEALVEVFPEYRAGFGAK